MSKENITESIQNDWESRELLEMVQLKVMDVTKFVNNFDQTVRFKLSLCHEKLTKLERSLELAEASVAVSTYATKIRQEAKLNAKLDALALEEREGEGSFEDNVFTIQEENNSDEENTNK